MLELDFYFQKDTLVWPVLETMLHKEEYFARITSLEN